MGSGDRPVRAKLRVLMVSDVSTSPAEGGGTRMLWEQSSRLVARGHDVRVVCRAQPASDAPVTERQGVRIRSFAVDRRTARGFMLSSMLGARRAVALELEKDRADVVHVHQPLAGYGVLTSPAVRGLPRLYSFHSPAPLEYRSRRGMTAHHRDGVAGRLGFAALWGLERACLRRATAIQVLSDYSSELLWKLYRISREKVVKIPGAVDTASFRPAEDRAAVRKALDLPAERSLLLTVRNLEGRMGLDLLIRTMAILTQNMPEALLLIGGAGTLRRELESLSNALGLRERVRFLGFIPDAALPLYYQAADVFVLPTRELEGFGLVTVEALACGTPVLGTPVGATPEILRPLCESLVFGGTAPEVMAQGLERFLEQKERDPDAYVRLRGACREHSERHYSWERATTELERALRRVAEGRADAPAGRADAPAGRAGPAPECPACGEPTRPSELIYRGVRHRQCGSCGSSLATVLPTAPELQHQYEMDYPLRFGPERVTAGRARLFGALLDRLATLDPGREDPPRLLDVGGGGGHLAALARGRGWLAVSTDLARKACAVALRGGEVPAVQADGALLPFRDGTIDAVTLVNVVDQAYEPLTILREAHRVLVAGGLLSLRVPNTRFHRPWVRLLIALGPLARTRGWDAYPIVHHFAFTPAGLCRLAERAGFGVLEVGNSTVAAREPTTESAATARLPRWGRVAIAASVTALAALSRDRCLVGP